MHHDVGAEIKGTHKVRGRCRAVDDERDASLMRHVRDTLQIDYVQFRVADELGEHRLRLFVQLGAHRLCGDFRDKARLDAECFQVAEQVDSPAEKPGARNHLVARLQNVQKRDGHRGHARRTSNRTDTLLERCDAAFKRICGGVPDARVGKTGGPVVENGF